MRHTEMVTYRVPLPEMESAILQIPVPLSGEGFRILADWLSLFRPCPR